ncbi:MAG: ATP synthase F0 subunit B [Floccifex porci]|uniref:ATP synthase subunit b n=1 Tax=Floccifex porci TaxID=2606629 RepID=A0A7X2N3B7_9FIRM|nr:ATP synthase F0 subunit B [Floccifex porci]MCI7802997.1 ATP synthase F0 subunit B [Erysipelotrichaceae bacterium]MDD7466774.1 ATP synthase F0 subunit B [Floccifex porci]MDO4479898.1 ATP synthase F0 subunit B [Erysipelotrichaceae bacterium]MDY4796239.1 ATP synthase F0 subunit B [Floccifex porci]MSS01704.1 ATP synthase F0 subunit B [Floccifex porci]
MPLNINFQQIFLHLFNFVILGGGLYLLLYKPVVDFMNKREQYFSNLEKETQQALEQAKEKEAQYNEKLNQFNDEMAIKKVEAIKECEKLVDARIQSAKEEASHILEDAHIKAKMHHDKMVEQAKEEITDLALDTAKKMMTDQDIYSQFVQACNQGDLDE